MLLRLSAGAVRVSRGTAVTPAAARRALVPPQQPRWVTVARAAERASGRRSLSATAEAATTPTAPKPTPSARPSTGSRRPGGEPSDQGPVSWKHFLATATIGGVLTAVFKYMEMRLADEKFRAVGRAALGGPFTLLDHNGDPKTDEDYRGEWLLLYFGFTHCPDICPNELNKITEVINALDASMYVGPVVRPVLITVDPRRDSVEKMRSYIQQFHPRMHGLTGTEAQVRTVTKAYRVYFNPTNDDDENYLVDHSIIAYLINPEGEFMAFYGQDELAPMMVPKIEAQIWEAKKRKFWRSIGLL